MPSRFIMYGEKVKGRISKNESVSLDKFQKDIFSAYTMPVEIELRTPTWFERLFSLGAYEAEVKETIDEAMLRADTYARLSIIDHIDARIDNDKRGRK